jgi:hypothetical protein
MNRVHEVKIQDLNASLPKRIDLFIASASFEARSLHISKALDRSRVTNSHIAFNANHWSYNHENHEALLGLFSNPIVPPTSLGLNSDVPVYTADSFLSSLRKVTISESLNVVIDITTFTREALAILLLVVRQIVPKPYSLTLLYNPASSYGDPKKLWLSKGLKQVRSILGYPGYIVPSRHNHLIILPGYELERASNLVATYEPNFLSIGVVPKQASFAADFYERQREFVKRLMSSYSSKMVETFEFSARDPFYTLESITECLKRHPESNRIVIPLNSKPSVVGACLACFQHPDVQLGYAQPEAYNLLEYSEPSDTVCVISLDSI